LRAAWRLPRDCFIADMIAQGLQLRGTDSWSAQGCRLFFVTSTEQQKNGGCSDHDQGCSAKLRRPLLSARWLMLRWPFDQRNAAGCRETSELAVAPARLLRPSDRWTRILHRSGFIGKLSPSLDDPCCIDRVPATVAIRMQPKQQPAHMIAGKLSRIARTN